MRPSGGGCRRTGRAVGSARGFDSLVHNMAQHAAQLTVHQARDTTMRTDVAL